MVNFFIGLGVGLFIGTFFGIMCVALVSANKTEDPK